MSKRPLLCLASFAAAVSIGLAGFERNGDANAATNDKNPPTKARLADLSWMTGAWRSAPGAKLVEEHWASPVGGSALGMCRLGDEPKKATYEIILLEEDAGGVMMTVRHFGAGLANKIRDGHFKLVQHDKSEATFEDPTIEFPRRLVYRRTSPKDLLIRLEGERKGKPVSEDLRLKALSDGSV